MEITYEPENNLIMNSYARELHGSHCDPVLVIFAFLSVLQIPTFISVYRRDPVKQALLLLGFISQTCIKPSAALCCNVRDDPLLKKFFLMVKASLG